MKITKLEFIEIEYTNRSLLVNDIIYQAGFGKTSLEEDINSLKILAFQSELYSEEQIAIIYLFLNGVLSNGNL